MFKNTVLEKSYDLINSPINMKHINCAVYTDKFVLSLLVKL